MTPVGYRGDHAFPPRRPTNGARARPKARNRRGSRLHAIAPNINATITTITIVIAPLAA
jgi:hypothetical protein